MTGSSVGGTGIGLLGVVEGGPLCWAIAGGLRGVGAGSGTGTGARGSTEDGTAASIICGGGV